jgi:Arc/MetJ family transcription regulator
MAQSRMITTVDVSEKQLAEVMRITGARSKREAIALGLQEVIDREKRRRIYALRGSAPGFKPPSRRRSVS